MNKISNIPNQIYGAILSVPVRIKIYGIVMLPVLILGLTLNYWITTGLSDWLSYVLIDARVEAAMQAGSRSVMLVTVLAALTSIFFALVLTSLLTRPLIDLYDTAQDVSEGRLYSRATVWSNDEIGKVASSVNTMIDELVASQEKLTTANQRLEAMNRIAMAAGREQNLPNVLDAILTGILDVMKLEHGWVYLSEGDGSRFYLARQTDLPEDLARVLQTEVGSSSCDSLKDLTSGKLQSGNAAIYHCLQIEGSESPLYPHTHVSIPLQTRSQVLGVINLLCPQNYRFQSEDAELIKAIGVQASEIIANAWLHTRLVEKEAARRALLESLVKTQEEERKRLAGELHDGAGQTLTMLLVRLKSLEKLASQSASPEPVKDALVNMQDLVAESIEEVRELSYRLRPATLEDFGLAMALVNLVEDMAEKAGLAVKTNCHLSRSLPSEIETALFRIAQESLTNVLRHAGASCVEVELLETPLGVCMRIEDNGQGFAPDELAHRETNHPHLGLISIQERAEMLGGSAAVFSAPGAGTSVQVRIPVAD